MNTNLLQMMEYVIAALVVCGMILLVALQRIDVTLAISTVTLALGYAFGDAKSRMALQAVKASD